MAILPEDNGNVHGKEADAQAQCPECSRTKDCPRGRVWQAQPSQPPSHTLCPRPHFPAAHTASHASSSPAPSNASGQGDTQKNDITLSHRPKRLHFNTVHSALLS